MKSCIKALNNGSEYLKIVFLKYFYQIPVIVLKIIVFLKYFYHCCCDDTYWMTLVIKMMGIILKFNCSLKDNLLFHNSSYSLLVVLNMPLHM